MQYYTIKFGADIDQASIIATLKGDGGDAIQVSDGLVAKTPLAKSDLEKALSPLSQHITVIELNPSASQEDPSLSKDARIFLGLQT